ncbi:MAG TPA: nucleoside phosphorylase [Anaerolineae bacterium]
MAEYPLLEHDESVPALIEPTRIIRPRDVPIHCVLCFFREVIVKLHQAGTTRFLFDLKSEMGPNPVYEFGSDGNRTAVVHPGVGASLASTFLEELIAFGCRKFIACGGAGVLDRELAVGHVIVPDCALRDEGTSYHYLPPGRTVNASPAGVEAIIRALQARGVEYVIGKTWTTDAPYRETPAIIQKRKAEGCLTVEMEAAALFSVAQFRHVTLAQILYGGDDVSGLEWDHRDWHRRESTREKIFRLAAKACLEIE